MTLRPMASAAAQQGVPGRGVQRVDVHRRAGPAAGDQQPAPRQVAVAVRRQQVVRVARGVPGEDPRRLAMGVKVILKVPISFQTRSTIHATTAVS